MGTLGDRDGDGNATT